MTIYRLAYVSRPSPGLTAEDLTSLAEAAARRNAEIGVTGLLIHEFNRFIQLLEGPLDPVETLMQAIIADKRHSDIRIFLQQSAPERSLSRWIMWSDFTRMAMSRQELLLREEIVRAALESLADLDAEGRKGDREL
ncbi:BLUF domain-containing protein [Jiella sonneratiae]|uniref:BLUF domain-containing protein n=1 Tax=Jiella sonneratiae TaxID=2816856 RepID=A0ABS3J1H6_9HYPH|nr:BLUF domain-containing protein [Jiella sonneratiae]MBO0903541.1 BLUF domain-containing protein [Jiella sonneratiae]